MTDMTIGEMIREMGKRAEMAGDEALYIQCCAAIGGHAGSMLKCVALIREENTRQILGTKAEQA